MGIGARLGIRISDASKRAISFVRQRPILVAVFLVLAVLAVSPIWRCRFLPLLDEPGHVSSVYIYRYIKDPAAHLAPYYVRSFRFVPYLLYHTILVGLSQILPFEIANKVLQSAYVLSFPFAAYLWLRRTGRSPILALLVFPLGYSYTWAHGFQPFNIGVPFLFFAVCMLDAFLEKPSVMRALGVAALAFCCEVAHPLVFLSLGGAAVALGIAYLYRPHRVLLAALLFSPSLVAVLYQIKRINATPFASNAAVTGVATTSTKSFDGNWVTWKEMLSNLPNYAMDSVSGDLDVFVFWTLVAVSIALLLTGLPARSTRAPLLQTLLGYRGALVCAALLGLYFAVPLHLNRPFDWWFVSGRLAGPLAFFGLLIPAGAIVRERRHLLVPAVLGTALLLIVIGNKYAEYGQRLAPMVRLAKKIPRSDTAILLSLHPRTDPSVNVEPYREVSAWLQVLRGGFSASGFFLGDHPFHATNPLPMPPWNSHESFDVEGQGKSWDWIMVRGSVPSTLTRSRSFELTARDADFSLYRRLGR